MKSKTSLRDSVSKEAMFFLLKNAKKRSRYKLKILFDFFIILYECFPGLVDQLLQS